ncbi:flagellar assembly protein FliW [Clostridium rectalis]|uniref:flagellar assembly protein FliW n=1 Tax=Clostridium rectalis TaxID=2040295 RepID=UPI000F63FDAA|nr:flagellar assembly protein FliW [Clostridium rectalis]
MKINTKCHGEIQYSEEDIITFEKGIPAFNNLTKFIVFKLQQNEVFSIIHSIEDLSIGIPVISPFVICKDYEVKLSEKLIESLKIEDEKDVMLLNTVTINSDIKNITCNLRAPIIINIKERLGEQIILCNESYNIKHPIFQEED